ncbi:hypothetical protein Tco_1376880 [Tanacetum coccineum]
MSLNVIRPYNSNLSRIQSSLMEYAAIEERQLLQKVAKLLAGYNNSEWSTRKWCRALGYFEVDVLASHVLPKFKSSTPNYQRVLLFTKPIADAPKPITDDIKKYADAVYASGFTIETFSMMPDFYSDSYTKLISLGAAGIDGAIIDTPKTASVIMSEPNLWSTRNRRDFYSTFHKTPNRMKFSEEEWDELTKESTRHVVAQLASSPEFTLCDNHCGYWLIL